MAWIHPDLSRAARRRTQRLPAYGPLAEFAVAALAGLGIVVATGAALAGTGAPLPPALLAGIAVYLAGAVVAGRHLHRSYPHGKLGLCNLVTLVRLSLMAALIPPLMTGGAATWATFAVALVALSLDGVDGWLARRQRLTSDFGARFDMEVDSGLALVLALLAWSGGSAGALVLVLGLPRYLFGAAGHFLPWLRGDLPERFSRKVVCVLQLGTLIALQLPFVTEDMSVAALAIVAVVLAWSFARDIVWLRQARG